MTRDAGVPLPAGAGGVTRGGGFFKLIQGLKERAEKKKRKKKKEKLFKGEMTPERALEYVKRGTAARSVKSPSDAGKYVGTYSTPSSLRRSAAKNKKYLEDRRKDLKEREKKRKRQKIYGALASEINNGRLAP